MLSTYQAFVQTDVPEGELIVSRTNLCGIITYANDVFAQISGYSVEELIGKPHNIVRHPDMPKSLFKELWETIRRGELWRGCVKNLRKDGGYYWVYAEVSGVYKEGVLLEYKSMRSPMSEEMKITFQEKYDALRAHEEGNIRIVSNISVSMFESLLNLAKQENKSPDTILNQILQDNLF